MYIVLDTETTNGLEDPITYDIGWAILDENYSIIETRSYVVADVFLDEKTLMQEAYFADKIPQYWADIKAGTRELKTFYNIKKSLREDCKNFNVKAIIAHNALFDYKSCTTTQRWLTSSKYRYFFPYGIELWDSLKMARQTFAVDEDYKKFCKENGYYVCGRPRLTAEVIYRYLTKDTNFSESHTGLEDVLIEAQIFKACLEKDNTIDCKLWNN